MKKKMTVLGVLLMVVAITSYSVGGTYAKYISAFDAADEARVAKWTVDFEEDSTYTINDLFKESYTYGSNGIVVKALGGESCSTTLTHNGITYDIYVGDYTYGFGQTKTNELMYKTNDKYYYPVVMGPSTTYNPVTSVIGTPVKKVCPTNDVVAPGTDGKYTFKVVGESEVNYKLNLKVNDSTVNTVYVPVKSGDEANLPAEKVITVDGNKVYSPLQFRVYKAGNESTATWGNLTELTTALNGLFSSSDVYGPTTDAGIGEYTIEWKWDFTDTTDDSLVDVYDTELGKNILGKTVKLDITLSAEQTQDAATINPAS